MLDAQFFAQQVKLMFTGGAFFVLAEQTVRELFSVVREDRANLE